MRKRLVSASLFRVHLTFSCPNDVIVSAYNIELEWWEKQNEWKEGRIKNIISI